MNNSSTTQVRYSILEQISSAIYYTDDLLKDFFNKVDEIDPVNNNYIDKLIRKIINNKCTTSHNIKTMIELGLGPNHYDEILSYCFRNRDIELAKYLVRDLAADINSFDLNNLPSLSNPDNLEIIKLLLDNDLVLSKDTLIFYEHINIIKLLFELNMDITYLLKFNNERSSKEVIIFLID